MNFEQLKNMTREMESVSWGHDRAVILFLDGRCYHVFMSYGQYRQLSLKFEREKIANLEFRECEETDGQGRPEKRLDEYTIKIVSSMYSSGKNYDDIAKKIGVSKTTANRYVAYLKSEGIIEKVFKKKPYDDAIIKWAKNVEFSKVTLAKKLGINVTTLYKRVEKLQEKGYI